MTDELLDSHELLALPLHQHLGMLSRVSVLLISLLSFSVIATPMRAIAAAPGIPKTEAVPKSAIVQAERSAENERSGIRKLLGGTDVKLSFNADLSILKGVDAGFRYTYEVQPAFQSGIYTRVDRWSPHARLKLPKIFTSVEPGAEVVYLRQFKNQADALKAKPRFNANMIPLSAENALRLEPGDVVMLPAHLDVFVGPQADVTEGPIKFEGRVGYLMRGLYQIQALRLADQRVRLRLVATRDEGARLDASAKLNLDIIEMGLLGKITEGIVGRHLANIGFGKGANSLVMADYIFDLNQADARDAYNHLLSSDRLLTNFKLVNPLVSKETLQDLFIADLGAVDQMADEDKARPREVPRRIVKIFKGSSTGKFETNERSVSLFRLFTLRSQSSFSSDNHVVFLDSENDEQDFFAPSFEQSKRVSALFGLRSETNTRKASIISPSGPGGKPSGMGEFVVSLEVKDKRMGKGEAEKVLRNLRRNVAPSIITALQIEPLLTATSYRNARVYAQVIFNEVAIRQFENVSSDAVADALQAHLRSVGEDGHAKDIRRVSESLAASMNTTLELKERIKLFMALQKDKFFRNFGTGTLMSMLPQDRLASLLSVYIRVDATAFKKPVEAQFGTSEFRGVVRATEYIEHLLNEGTFDLRLETFGTASGSIDATDGRVVSLKSLKEAPPTSAPLGADPRFGSRRH